MMAIGLITVEQDMVRWCGEMAINMLVREKSFFHSFYITHISNLHNIFIFTQVTGYQTSKTVSYKVK